jgi:CubicO group peptidase (beta-lactamase class C family)
MTKKLGQGFAVIVLLLPLIGQVQSQTSKHSKTEPAVAPSAVTVASPTAAPEELGLSSERLERIASAIQKSVDDGRIAGGVCLVARHGKIACFKAVGMADRDAKKPMRTDSIFRICSMSKPLTSVAVMMLCEEGKFNLNQPVSDFLPEFKNMKVLDPSWPQDRTSPPGALVDAKRPITILDPSRCSQFRTQSFSFAPKSISAHAQNE